MPGKWENPYSKLPDPELLSEQFARKEDDKDPSSRLRDEFIVPSKADLNHKRYGPAPKSNSDGSQSGAPTGGLEESIYLCGNSLGLQPRRTREYIQTYLDTWASKGVYGHFKELEDGGPPWLHLDDAVKDQTSKIVGALPSEVVVMETLTANLHLLLASFYRPTKDRYKIIIEGKAFPSDHVSPIHILYNLSLG
jgi:kynureninase